MTARRAVVSALAPRPWSPDARPRVPISFPLRLRPTPYIEQHGFRGAIHFPAHLLGPRCSVRPGDEWIAYVLATVWIPYVQVTRALYTSRSYRTSHTDVGGFYTSHPRVDSIHSGHAWISYVLATVWISYVQATRGFYTSWPIGLHTSQPSVDSIRPTHMGRPTRPAHFMDSICPTQVWIPYVLGASVAFEPERWTLESSLLSVYGCHTSWSHVDSMRPTRMDIECILYIRALVTMDSMHPTPNESHTSQPHVHSKHPAHTGPTRPGHCTDSIHPGPGHCGFHTSHSCEFYTSESRVDPICPGQCVDSYTSHPCMHSIGLTHGSHTSWSRMDSIHPSHHPHCTNFAGRLETRVTEPGAAMYRRRLRWEKDGRRIFYVVFYFIFIFLVHWSWGQEPSARDQDVWILFFYFFRPGLWCAGGIGIGCKAWPVCRKKMK